MKLEFFERKFFDLADQLRFFIAQEQFFFVAETFGWSGCLSYGWQGLILVYGGGEASLAAATDSARSEFNDLAATGSNGAAIRFPETSLSRLRPCFLTPNLRARRNIG